MPQTSFTYDTDASLIGSSRASGIFQVIQQIHPKATAARPWWGSFRIDPAELKTVAGEPVLVTRDPLTGNSGTSIERIWTFNRGVPISMDKQTTREISRALKQIVPQGSELRGRGDTLDLENLALTSDAWKPGDSTAQPTCRSVVVRLGVQNHRIVVASKQYIP
jgi:hypothetical protein